MFRYRKKYRVPRYFSGGAKSSVPASTRGAFGGPPAAADTGAENIGEGRRRLGKQRYAAARRISVGNGAGIGRRAGVRAVRDRWAC